MNAAQRCNIAAGRDMGKSRRAERIRVEDDVNADDWTCSSEKRRHEARLVITMTPPTHIPRVVDRRSIAAGVEDLVQATLQLRRRLD